MDEFNTKVQSLGIEFKRPGGKRTPGGQTNWKRPVSPHMNVTENLAFPLQERGKGKAEITERIQKVLDRVELPFFSHRGPIKRSGRVR